MSHNDQSGTPVDRYDQPNIPGYPAWVDHEQRHPSHLFPPQASAHHSETDRSSSQGYPHMRKDATLDSMDKRLPQHTASDWVAKMSILHDRGKTRTEEELKLLFNLKTIDINSTDTLWSTIYLCAYVAGLQIFHGHIDQLWKSSDSSMETDEAKHIPGEVDDFVSDWCLIQLGEGSDEYEKLLQSAEEFRRQGMCSWNVIHHSHLGVCRATEAEVANDIQSMRRHPDLSHHCREHILSDTMVWLAKWKQLNTVKMALDVQMESLARSENPCTVEYSTIELNFNHDFVMKVNTSENVIMPEDWKDVHNKPTKTVRCIREEIEDKYKSMYDAINTHIVQMDDQRKAQFTLWQERFAGLQQIVSKLERLLNSAKSEEHVADFTKITDEELWYNESNYGYADTYLRTTDMKEKLPELYDWGKLTNEERNRYSSRLSRECQNVHKKYGELVDTLRCQRELLVSLSTKVADDCFTLHQRYGKLVKTLRTHRESIQGGIKTHVSELDSKLVQLQSQKDKMENEFKVQERRWYEKDLKTQQTNADLTTQLDQAQHNVDQTKEQINSYWQKYIHQIDTNHKWQQEQLQGNLAEMRKKMADLKLEKENLLTRLSKIAGSKLVQGNPAITDLSDPNRPTKVSEMYSELYDNEWTDALEELADTEGIVQGEEVVCTKTLLAILIEAFTFCCETEANYTKTITQSLTSLPGPDSGSTEQEQKDATTLTGEQTQQLDDLRKTCVPLLTTAVESKFLTLMEKRFEHLFKQAGGQMIRSDKNMSHPGEDRHEDESVTPDPTDDHAASADNAGDHNNVLSDADQSNPTPKQKAVATDLSSKEQATPEDGAICPDQQTSGQAGDKNHKRFDIGCSNEMSDQGNPQKDTGQRSNTTDTICHAQISALEKTSRFAKTCVNICWFMRIQNPPMHMDTELVAGSDINVDFYKNYTQKGKKVGYLVWPAIFLHKDGPLLCKGIVQPLSKTKG